MLTNKKVFVFNLYRNIENITMYKVILPLTKRFWIRPCSTNLLMLIIHFRYIVVFTMEMFLTVLLDRTCNDAWLMQKWCVDAQPVP